MNRNTLIALMIVVGLLLACGVGAAAVYLFQAAPQGITVPPLDDGTRDTPAATTAPEPTAETSTTLELATGGPYNWSTMADLDYNWDYTPQPGNPTPKIRDDAESSGKGVTVTHDIGVHPGELGVIKGVTITVGEDGPTLGTPCALAILTPGFYRNITGTEWRFEVYFLPESDPLDPTGWSRVLAEQAAEVEETLYDCPAKSLSEIPVFFSNEDAPFGQ